MAAPIQSITGIKVSKPRYATALTSGLDQLVALGAMSESDRPQRMAFASSLHSFNILMSAASTICQRDPIQGNADIDLISDGSGKLIYRCHHSPAHEWDLDGNIVK